MLGTDFKRTLRAAQTGDEGAFVRLWRDANPAMIRYLRVVGVDDPYDGACEGWITVMRGLAGFSGDETAWRVWLLACARMRAEEGTLRKAWGSVTVLPSRVVDPSDEPIDIDDLEDPDEEIRNRGLNHTLAAVRSLPLGQGEVIMLRLAAGLPVSAVADVVGTDAVAIRRSETRGLERLGIDRELLTWSLVAPASAAELADETVVTQAYRSLPRPRNQRGMPGTKVIALLPVGGSARPDQRRGDRHQPPVMRGIAGLSRTAAISTVAISASVMSLGGLGAAAYVGALPAPIQSVLHDALRVVPAPGSHSSGNRGGTPVPPGRPQNRGGKGSPASPTSSTVHSTGSPTTKVHPSHTPAHGAPSSAPGVGSTKVPPSPKRPQSSATKTNSKPSTKASGGGSKGNSAGQPPSSLSVPTGAASPSSGASAKGGGAGKGTGRTKTPPGASGDAAPTGG